MFAASPGQLVESLNVMKACVKIPVLNHQFSCRLDWPARTLSFSHDGKMLASASEDHFIDIAEVETGPCRARGLSLSCLLHVTVLTKQFNQEESLTLCLDWNQ